MNLDTANQNPEPGPPPLPPRASRLRWWIHVIVIGCYPVILGIMGYVWGGEHHEAALSNTPSGVLQVTVTEMLTFGIIFMVAWSASRASLDELLLRWRNGFLTPLLGAGYSVALRIALAILVGIGLTIYAKVTGADIEQTARVMQPKVEAMVDFEALSNDSLYLFLNLTLISFVVAGFREELWRAGFIAGLSALCPKWFGGKLGRIGAVCVAAVLFGLGHLPQGWGAVCLTGLLGVGLGTIMVLHRSVWEAVLAHGFFNATSFLLISLLNKYAPDLMG